MNSSNVSLLILAAGMGSRYGGLKQIDKVGPSGETILDYSIYDAISAGFNKIVFVIRRDIEKEFKEIVGSRYESLVEVKYVFQELDALPDGFTPPDGRTKPWGTAHAILVASSVINEPFGVINADDFYGKDAYNQLFGFLSKSIPKNNHAMVGYKMRNTLSAHGTVSRGVCVTNREGCLETVQEVTAISKQGNGAVAEGRDFTGDEIVSMNLWGFQPSIFDAISGQFKKFLQEHGQEMKSEFYIPFVVDEEIRSGHAKVNVLETESQWTGVTYREDKPAVEAFIQKLIQQDVYPENLFQVIAS